MKRLVLALLFFIFLPHAEAQVCHTLSINSTSILCNGNATGSATVTATGGTTPYTYTWLPAGGNASVASALSAGIYTVRVSDAGTCVVEGTVNIAQPNFFLAVSTKTNILCYGASTGIISFTTVGGTNPKSYTWSPYGGNGLDATGLSPGTFTFFIKDANNCTLTETVAITGPSFSLVATTTQTNNLCGNTNGGASAQVTGGTTPYTYTWLPTGGTNSTAVLVSGIYTVNIRDANNCAQSQTVNILQSSQFTLTPTVRHVTCNGAGNGSVSTSVSGGTLPFTYTWNPTGGNASSASGLVPGTYTLSATDGVGCTNFTTATITQPAILAATSTQTNILCNAGTGSASVTASGGVTAYSYTWLPSGGNAALATGLTVGGYTVTVRDASLCTITQTFNFTQPAALASTVTQTNILCFGAATGTAGISVSGGVTPYTYTWTPVGGNAASATGLIAGIYTVTARDNNSCTISRNYTITQPAQITTVAATTSVSCNGQSTGSATLTVSGGLSPYSYSWSPSGGTASVAVSLPAGTYSVKVTDANNCSITPTLAITQPAVLASVLSRTAVTCFGLNNGSATLTVSGGVAPYSYSWTPGGATTPSVSSLVPGNYTATVKDANGCSNLHTFTITSPPQYTLASAVTNVLCSGQTTGSGTVTVLGGTPAYSYTWLPSGGSASVASGLGAGDYTVNIRDANNCATSRTVSITEPSAITGTINSSPANCNNPDGSAIITVNGGAGGYTYSWSPAGGNTATATAISAGQYTCTVTDLNNCKLSLITGVAAINPSVILTALSSTICSGASTTLSAAGSDSYTWAPASSLSSASGSVVTASPLVTTMYTVTGSNLFGCTVTNTITLHLFADPVPTLSINGTNLCTGNTASLSATGAVNFTWTPATGLSNAFISDPTVTLGIPVIYTVTGTDALGCIGTNTLSVSPLPLPNVTVSAGTSSVCPNETITLTSGGAVTYSWSTGASTSTLAVAPLTSTNYVVTGTGTNSCKNTATMSVGVNASPLVSINSNTYVCQGATATLTAAGAATYSWSTGATSTSITESPATNSSYTVIGTDVNGCKDTANFNLIVFITPTLTISGKQEVCRNEKFTLNASGATTYTWSTGDTTPAITYAFASGTVLTVSSGVPGCPPGTASLSVTVNASPSLSVAATPSAIHVGQDVQLYATSNATKFAWLPAGDLDCTDCPGPLAKPAATVTYTVEVSNQKGCKSSATVLVQVESGCGDLFMPSAFSPNYDGLNDTWCVYGNCIETLQCEIFNRWGQKVFTISAKDQCWDGNVNGVQQNSGTFIFQVKVTLTNGESKSLKGNFTLVR